MKLGKYIKCLKITKYVKSLNVTSPNDLVGSSSSWHLDCHSPM